MNKTLLADQNEIVLLKFIIILGFIFKFKRFKEKRKENQNFFEQS